MFNKKLVGLSLLIVSIIVPVIIFIFIPESPTTTAWIEDPSFENSVDSPWFSVIGGDQSDVSAEISSQHANFIVQGDKRTFSDIVGTPNSSTSLGWKQVRNGDFLFPDTALIISDGCYVSHFLDENVAGGQVRNYPSVHWKNNLSLPVNMNDYVITSASIQVICNASVDDNVDTPYDNYTSGGPDQFAIGDDVTFYVEISDLEESVSFRVAEYKSEYLGQLNLPNYPAILTLNDTNLNYVSETDLIAALTSVLETDNYNFTITLGIDIYCEDNDGSGDQDGWDNLLIKTCNMSFTYQKKIDQFTTVSFNQEAGIISGDNLKILSGKFNFNYSITSPWPSAAPLSELRFFINNKLYEEESFLLGSASTEFKKARVDDFDITSFLEKDVNTTVSIQLFLKDSFELNQSIVVYLDDVLMTIQIIELEEDMTWLVLILLSAMAVLGLAILLYYTIFQYPPLIRKIRGLKKKIIKRKAVKPINVKSRDEKIKEILVNKYIISPTETRDNKDQDNYKKPEGLNDKTMPQN